jgi:hypothetical protein
VQQNVASNRVMQHFAARFDDLESWDAGLYMQQNAAHEFAEHCVTMVHSEPIGAEEITLAR